MKALPGFDFGIIIAFFLPGFVAIFALSYLSPRVSGIMSALLSKDQSFGASFITVAIALAAGMIISGIRAFVLDSLHQKTWKSMPDLDYSKLTDKDKLAVFNEAINNTYRFYQFYGNMFVALAFLTWVRYAVADVSIRCEKTLFACTLFALVGLLFQSRNTFRDTYEIADQILQ
jgi:hypothetical protein